MLIPTIKLPYYRNHQRYGHWLYNGDSNDLINAFGFTYVITNLTNHKKYIGCKQIKTVRKGKQSWHNYTGSNKELNDDIHKIGKDNFLFEIIGIYNNRMDLRMAEAKWILNADALYRNDYYNQYLQLRVRIHNSKKINYLPKLKKVGEDE